MRTRRYSKELIIRRKIATWRETAFALTKRLRSFAKGAETPRIYLIGASKGLNFALPFQLHLIEQPNSGIAAAHRPALTAAATGSIAIIEMAAYGATRPLPCFPAEVC